ncbi:hypothetical protein M885DRAFT_561068 [Pelagophyceae sp. CCMP2097]|nr:hypothetical protein M885DRAFT_561068 [Pelagophyceae sp. CCMP2097]
MKQGYVPQQAQVVQAQVVQQPQPLVVTCPPGLSGGQPMQVVNPETGQTMQVNVPQGVQPGGQQDGGVQFPPPQQPVYATAQPVYAQQPVQVQVVHAAVVHQAASANSRACRGCGTQFVLEPGMNPATAAAFRCKRCRGLSSMSFF